jgi:hypothetical protein
MTKTQAISLQVLELVNNGMEVVEALKAVCGSELVDTMITNLYDGLRAAK